MDHRIMYTFLDAYDQNYKINSRVWQRLLRPILSVISSLSFFSRLRGNSRLTISLTPRASPRPLHRGRIPALFVLASSPASSPWSVTAFDGKSGLKERRAGHSSYLTTIRMMKSSVGYVETDVNFEAEPRNLQCRDNP